MKTRQYRHLIVETAVPGVKVVRFVRPDLRPYLDDYAWIDDCEVFHEFQQAVLADLAPGEVLVVNLGLLEVFTSAALNFLLRLRQCVASCQGQLVLCRLRDQHEEIMTITQTGRLFRIAGTETEAIRQAVAN